MTHIDSIRRDGDVVPPFVVRPMAGRPAVLIDLIGPAPDETAERLRAVAAECAPPAAHGGAGGRATVRALGPAVDSSIADATPDGARALATAMRRLLRGRGFDVMAGRADHRFLVDLSSRVATARRAERALADIGVRVCGHVLSGLPGWPSASPILTIDTTAIAGRGLHADGARHLAAAMADVLDAVDDTATGLRARRQVRAVCERAGLVVAARSAGDGHGD